MRIQPFYELTEVKGTEKLFKHKTKILQSLPTVLSPKDCQTSMSKFI